MTSAVKTKRQWSKRDECDPWWRSKTCDPWDTASCAKQYNAQGSSPSLTADGIRQHVDPDVPELNGQALRAYAVMLGLAQGRASRQAVAAATAAIMRMPDQELPHGQAPLGVSPILERP